MPGRLGNVVAILLLVAASVFGGVTDISECKYKADNGDIYDLSKLKNG